MPTRPTSARPRIAVAGFQHETNTFAPTRASLVDFEKQDAWPALTAGEALYDVFPPLNIPLGGFLKAARDSMDLVPLLWASAEPSGHVEETAYEAIADSILSGIESAGKLDGIYLDLHGAMVTEHLDDGEGELLRRIRMLVGDDLPLAVSLDLHANVTEAMVEHASIMTVFRTYPHIDMAATGARACGFLYRILENQERIFKERRLLPFLLPLSAQSTDLSPAKEIYRDLIAYEAPGLLNLEFAMGFPPADLWDSGSAFLAYGNDPEETQAAADGFLKLALDLESEFHNDLLEPDEAVSTAVVESGPGRTYVLADVQDNPGAGGTSDTTGLLQALVKGRAKKAALGIFWDPASAAAAHEAGCGARIRFELGGKSGPAGVDPFIHDCEVEALGSGQFTCTGPMYGGSKAELGLMACLRVCDDASEVRVVVSSKRFQAADQAPFRHVGAEPAEQNILVLKSTAHFRADFTPLAAKIILVKALGHHPCDFTKLDYKKLRGNVRLGPMGPLRT
jgi:microcystin degradation protein MlrC